MPDKPKCVGHVPLKDDNGVKLRDEHGKVQTRPCRMRPINGGTVCGAHGGSAKRKLAGEVVLWKDLAAELVADLREYRHTDGRGAEQLRSEIAVLERAFDRCNTVLATIARLNIDERLMVITEAQAELVLTAIDAALTFAAVPADQLGPARLHAVQYLKTAS
jgi:hypothetical protein